MRRPRNTALKEKRRPAWWTPEEVLDRLQAGESAGSLCDRAAAEVELAPQTLRGDIAVWQDSLRYGEQFTRALELKGGSLGAPDRELFESSWYPRFWEAMDLEEGNVAAACARAEVKPRVIYALIDPKGEHYDRAFASRFRVMEGQRRARIRENVLKQAESPDADGAKIGLKILEAAEPHLHAPPQKVEVSGVLGHALLPPQLVAAAEQRARLVLDREPKRIGEGSAS